LSIIFENPDERRLRKAANLGNSEMLNKILELGVNPNCGDELGRTALRNEKNYRKNAPISHGDGRMEGIS